MRALIYRCAARLTHPRIAPPKLLICLAGSAAVAGALVGSTALLDARQRQARRLHCP
jgi:hypothetical protein